jgi:hypothetical protein
MILMAKSYNLVDVETNTPLAKDIPIREAVELRETYKNIGYNTVKLFETAAAGSIGAGSIAINMAGDGKASMQSLRDFMNEFNSKVKNRFVQPSNKLKQNFFININESFDIDSVFSRLGSMEKKGETRRTEGVTFGIEDDNGNIMKVTVRADQAKDFEAEVARYLADIKLNVENLPLPRNHKEISMAELLFNMRTKFDIIDVEFPNIPDDVIYNADDASPANNVGDNVEAEIDELNNPLDLTDFDEVEDNEANLDNDETEEIETDSDTVEDFPESESEEQTMSDEGSILAKVIDMLKSQADSEIERAKAEAEKARAEQARYTAQATQFAIRDQEEQLKYEMEIEEQKEREKEAKRVADLAKHRITQKLDTIDGIREGEEFATPDDVSRERRQALAQFDPKPEDSADERAYKAKQKAAAIQEWNAKMREAQNSQSFKARQETQKRVEQQKNDTKDVVDARINNSTPTTVHQ